MLISLVVCIAFCLVGCGNKAEAPKQTKEEDEKLQIGFSMDSFLIERWQRDRDVFVSKAQELGAEVNVQNANGDLNEQISQIEYFIDKNVDVIVIVAADCNGMTDIVAKAKKAGIPVIAYDRLISDANVDLYVSFDNYMVGELMGQAIASRVARNGNIVMINGPLTDTNVPLIIDGFKKAIAPYNINVNYVAYAEAWRAETAFEEISQYLKTPGKTVPDGIMCGNDSLAGQAIKALAENREAGSVVVTGQDADLDACQRIVEGTQYMTVYKPVEKLAGQAAELAVKLAKGEGIDISETISDGTYDVPYEKLEPVAVTKNNMDEVIIGSYHQRDEVYLNVKTDE